MVNNNQEQSNTGLQLFSFEGQDVRAIWINAEAWYVLTDVCKILGLGNPAQVATRLKKEGCITRNDITDALGRPRETLCVNLPNYLRAIMRSDKPDALRFQDWVCEEVVPTILKTGSYSMDNRSPKEQLQDQLGMLQFVHKIVRGVFRSLSQRWIVENKQFALYGKVAFDYFRLEVMRANREYSAVVKYFHGDNVFDGLNLKGDIVKMRSEIRNGEISVQLQFPFIEDAR